MAKVTTARDEELRNSVKYYITEAISSIIWHTSPLMVAFVTFFAYTKLAGNVLDATTAFTGLALLNSLREPLMSFPHELIQLYQAFVSLNRIEKYLKEEEIEKYSAENEGLNQENALFGFDNAAFTYHSGSNTASETKLDESVITIESETTQLLPENESTPIEISNFLLKNSSLNMPMNGLTVVCGSTGAGKSTLIYALLGGIINLIFM